MNNQQPLLTPTKMNGFGLQNRVVMAPMTRNRAGEGNAPTDLNIEYYKQRASASFIITEGTQISEQGIGYPSTPGIHTEKQIEGWKKITDSVHEEGGRIFAQIWHVGRISHPDYHNGEPPVAPSPIKPKGKAFTYEGLKPFEQPRSLEIDEIRKIIEDYAQAARNAIDAGFDGVEIHGANGYLIDQFIQDGTNQRTDRYGGSIENRARFALEVTDEVAAAVGSQKTGIRLSPCGLFNDMSDSNPKETFSYLIEQLNNRNLAYLHLVEPLDDVSHLENYLTRVTPFFRKIYDGTLITCGNYDRESGNKVIDKGEADLVAYARLFLANPDLPERFAANANLNEPDPDTFYGGGEEGYTDYPAMKEK